MTDDHKPEAQRLATPAITKGAYGERSLDMSNVDMSRDGVQGEVVVSKGRASTVVSMLPDPDSK